jgi:predicted GNAT family acetyltransferase
MRISTPHGAYEIDSMPSQPQVAICHGFFVPLHLRGKGLANKLKQHQAQMLSNLFYDYATCTVCSSNSAQKHVLQNAGWRMLSSFRSSKTGDPVELWGCTVHRQ